MQKERDKRISKRTTQGLQPMKFSDRDLFEEKLRGLTTLKVSVADAMMCAMDLNYCTADVVSSILAASIEEKHNPDGLTALAYLISDVLFNSAKTTSDFWSFRLHFEWVLPDLFEIFNFCWRELQKKNSQKSKTIKQEESGAHLEIQEFKGKIMRLIQLWNNWAVYDSNLLNGLETLFLCESLEESYSKTNEIRDHITFRLTLYLDKLPFLSREKLEREAHNQGVSARGSIDQMIKRLRVVELAKLEKVAKNFPALWSSKKFSLAEANTQMALFMKKFGNSQENNFLPNEDDIDSLSKEAIEEWMSIGISLLQFLKGNNNQFFKDQSVPKEGIPFSPFEEVVFEVKQTSKVYVQPGFEVIEESIKPDYKDEVIPCEQELNGIALTNEEIVIIVSQKHESTIVSKYDISYLNKKVSSQNAKKEEISHSSSKSNAKTSSQNHPLSKQQRTVSPQKMGQKYQKLNLPSITSFKKGLESQTKHTSSGYSGLRGSSRRNRSSSSSSRSESSQSSSSSSSSSYSSSSASHSRNKQEFKGSKNEKYMDERQDKRDRYDQRDRYDRTDRSDRNNLGDSKYKNDRKDVRSRSRSNSQRRYQSKQNSSRTEKRQRRSNSYSPHKNERSGKRK